MSDLTPPTIVMDRCLIQIGRANIHKLEIKAQARAYFSPSKTSEEYTVFFVKTVFPNVLRNHVIQQILRTLFFIICALLYLIPNFFLAMANFIEYFSRKKAKEELETLSSFYDKVDFQGALLSNSQGALSNNLSGNPTTSQEIVPSSVVGSNFTVIPVHPSKKRAVETERKNAEKLVIQKTRASDISSGILPLPQDESLALAPLSSKNYAKFQELFSSMQKIEKKTSNEQYKSLCAQKTFLDFEVKLALLLYYTPFLKQDCSRYPNVWCQKIFNAWHFILDIYNALAWQCLSTNSTLLQNPEKLKLTLNAFFKKLQGNACTVETKKNSQGMHIHVLRNEKFLFSFDIVMDSKEEYIEKFCFPGEV